MAPHAPQRSERPGEAGAPLEFGLPDVHALLAVLQLADGLFPAGGFAHSLGLETYTQDGRVRDATGLAAFIAATLDGSAGPCDAAAAALAARRASAGDLAALLALDARLEAMKPVPETRAASRQMGRQTLRVSAALRSEGVVAELARAVTEGRAAGHHAVAFGAALGTEGAEASTVATAYLHATASMLVGAGVRLLALGQLDGQRVLASMRPRIERLAAAAARAGTADDLWSFTPSLEIAGVRHATLDARLFRS
ncbi:MAG: urease accessory protein [Candidatus Rokubacteria bacterium]|nr:urease accessory protein [Candidatus Rokubacteria bacterium]